MKIKGGNEDCLEFLVTDGIAEIKGETCNAQSWGRLPAGEALAALVGPTAAQVWIKAALLQDADVVQIAG